MLSRFSASHSSQSQPWLAPKRLISRDQSPSPRCPDGIRGFLFGFNAVAAFSYANGGCLLVGYAVTADAVDGIDQVFDANFFAFVVAAAIVRNRHFNKSVTTAS